MAVKTFIQIKNGVVENTFIVEEEKAEAFLAVLKQRSPGLQFEDVTAMEIYPTPGYKKLGDDFESPHGISLKEISITSKAIKNLNAVGKKATAEDLLAAETAIINEEKLEIELPTEGGVL